MVDIKKARQLKKESPDYVLMDERSGLKQPGFDYGNSPAEIEKVNFNKKTVILTTSTGTQGIANAINSDEIITGAFVNIVSLVCTDDRLPDNEDFMLASYLKKRLRNKKVNFGKIQKHLERHRCACGFLKNPMTKWSKKDFSLVLSLDRFNFVLKAKKEKETIYLEKT